jgi:hypothetical protein
LVGDFFAADFLAGDFFAADFLAGDFFAAGVLAGAAFAPAFLADAVLAGLFVAVAFFGRALLGVPFLVVAVFVEDAVVDASTSRASSFVAGRRGAAAVDCAGGPDPSDGASTVIVPSAGTTVVSVCEGQSTRTSDPITAVTTPSRSGPVPDEMRIR